ncbi:intercellular trafficking and secretion [Apophysomyces ossiformis]|uniref:Sorting nexin-4 n=1 Tax=Apophysomyces ossiformis TaxID=679940 RepID=A0A8H7ERI8_9FUNG|nr:intercellular trafficking and secretion [Apophysomyces ossiformis]
MDSYETISWNTHETTSGEFSSPLDSDDPLSVNKRDAESVYVQSRNAFHSQESFQTASMRPSNGSAHSLEYPTPDPVPPPSPPQNETPELINHESLVPEQMTIQISDAQKHTDATQGPFVTYLITTETAVKTFSSRTPRPVRRRFQDFVWLHNALTLEFPASIVPPLPDRHRLEYIKGDRFSAGFIERRRLGLQWFLDRIAWHPWLQQSQSTRVFLESNDFKNDKQIQSRHVPPPASVLESLSDTLLNAFARVKRPDERFINMKDNIDKFEESLSTVERLYARISKRQHDLQQDYASFASSIQGLSALETNITYPLLQFADTTRAYVEAMKKMTNNEELLFLNDVHELLAYCHAAKAVLKARDQKQVDFEALSAYLQQAIEERDRLRNPRAFYNSRSSVNITEFMTDRINEVRGVDMQHARREKLTRLERKINSLTQEVASANDTSNRFSEQLIKEFEVFQRAKTKELKQGLTAYADCHIEFFRQGASIWEEILPVLEEMKIEDDDYIKHQEDGEDTNDTYNVDAVNGAQDAEDIYDGEVDFAADPEAMNDALNAGDVFQYRQHAGLGLEMSKALAEAGADVAVMYVSDDNTHTTAKEIGEQYGVACRAYKAEITDAKAVQAAIEAIHADFGHIDVFVANAGVSKGGPAEVGIKRNRELFDVNVHGVFYGVQAVSKYMLERGQGNIILISSISAAVANQPQAQCGYNCTKASISMMTKCLASEWATRGIRVNAICPGYMQTDMLKNATTNLPELVQAWKNLTPVRRLGHPKEIRGAVVFLASEASSYVTGTELFIDGGYTAV